MKKNLTTVFFFLTFILFAAGLSPFVMHSVFLGTGLMIAGNICSYLGTHYSVQGKSAKRWYLVSSIGQTILIPYYIVVYYPNALLVF